MRLPTASRVQPGSAAFRRAAAMSSEPAGAGRVIHRERAPTTRSSAAVLCADALVTTAQERAMMRREEYFIWRTLWGLAGAVEWRSPRTKRYLPPLNGEPLS